ncbi:hypothetical protein EDC96DRAFT_569740 [Choanephora cucurbitarum]|nr:hypothetical protein EDC96DRAFT_569740 [Choanephora cucurbitarum]
MPTLIQKWIPTLPPSKLQSWKELKRALLNRFGLPEEADNQKLLQDLKQCKQQPNEFIRIHASNWENLLSRITETYSEDTKITFFIQSLHQRDIRLSLTSLVEAMNLDTVSRVIDKAIALKDRAKLMKQPQLETDGPTPMDLDHFQRHKHKTQQYKKPFNQHFKDSASNQASSSQQLRAYDKFGNPICDFCKGKHRTKDCQKKYSQYKRSSSQPTKQPHQRHKRDINLLSVDGTNSTKDVTSSASSKSSQLSLDIAHMAAADKNSLPQSKLIINNHHFVALWDSGAAVTAIDEDTATKLNAKVDSTKQILYRDVNNNIQHTLRTTPFHFGGTEIEAHVIAGLSKPIILGWDTISQLNGILDASKQTITVNINEKQITIPLINKQYSIQAMEDTKTITDEILKEYNDVIATNPNKPSVTHLVEFTIDTGDNPPVFAKT